MKKLKTISGEQIKSDRERTQQLLHELFHDYEIKTPDLSKFYIKPEKSNTYSDSLLSLHEYKLPDLTIEPINLFIPIEKEKYEITIEGVNLTEITPGQCILHSCFFPTDDDDEIKIEEINPTTGLLITVKPLVIPGHYDFLKKRRDFWQ